MRLPAGDRAVVDIAKLRDYCLNPSHPRGKHKARVFAATLGLSMNDAEFLREHLLQAAMNVDVTPASVDAFGRRYWMETEIVRGSNRAILRGAWIIRGSETAPRLVTCYVQLA